MGNTVYRDLAAFGLPLVTPTQPEFTSLVHDIQSRPGPFGSWPIDDLSNAAVLLNETGSAILSISYSWRYTTARGGVHSSHCSNLGSCSIQLDVLSGRSEVVMALEAHARFTNLTRCASTAQITSGGRTHPRRLLVELGSLRASESETD